MASSLSYGPNSARGAAFVHWMVYSRVLLPVTRRKKQKTMMVNEPPDDGEDIDA
jgi:hypothetical protein